MTGPEHYREAERLANRAHHFTYGDGGDPTVGLALATEAQVHATLALAAATALITGTKPAVQPGTEAAPAVVSVFKAAWGMTPLGTYTNLSAAQTHCMADAANNAENPDKIAFEWFGDAHEPGDPCELLITVGGKQESSDYTVTRVEVDVEYDPEADA